MSIASSPIEIAEQCAGIGTSFWISATQIAEEEGTPFYVYLPHRTEAAYHHFASALQYWGSGRVAFSVKTNPLYALLYDLRGFGAFAEVVSTWELSHAISAGFAPEEIVFNGPLKTEKDLRWVFQTPPLAVNVDSMDELDAIERAARSSPIRANVGLRLCPPRENGAWSRFGLEMSTGELGEALTRIRRSRSLVLRCIHFHLGTQVYNASRYFEMMALVRELWSRHLLSSDVWLDIGGGFPYDHAVPLEEQTFLPSRFFSALADAWGAAPRPPLLTEPGRLISAPTMAVVSRVLASKPRTGEPTIVVLDSGTNHNVMAAFYEHLWLYTDATTGAARHRFCGPLCMEDDVLSGERHAAPPKNGALVATFNAGAYSVALSRSFIQPRPPIFTLQSGGGFQLLQYRETPDRAYEFGKSTLRQPGHKSELRGS